MRERVRYSQVPSTTTTSHVIRPMSSSSASPTNLRRMSPPPSQRVDDADIAAGQTTTTSTQKHLHKTHHHHHGTDAVVATTTPPSHHSHLTKKDLSAAGPNGTSPPYIPSYATTDVTTSAAATSSNSFTARGSRRIPRPPRSAATLASVSSTGVYPSDLEFFEDLVSEPVLVLGVDISHLDRTSQFLVCASGVFGFSLLYGYLQELISVRICGRQLGLFLAMVQFTGYTVLAFFLRNFVYAKEQRRLRLKQQQQQEQQALKQPAANASSHVLSNTSSSAVAVPLILYLGLSVLRAIDLAMTNMAMQYINYPAKTLMKSSRVVFTMLFGVVISRKSYKWSDYAIVLAMVAGLALFMHADANSSAVFDLAGVFMLTISLLCDGAISNVSESIMSQFGVGQDEFIFRVYSIALVAITAAAVAKGDFFTGFQWLFQPGTYDELDKPVEERTWTVMGKITVIVLFSTMGFFGSSCSAAITKNFGALTMSITSTARKAATLFLSFFLFHNVCTWEHVLGVVVFIAALTAKSLRRSKGDGSKHMRRGVKSKISPWKTLRSQQGNNLGRRLSTGDLSSSGASVSDISDVELGAFLAPDGTTTDIPTIVHTNSNDSNQTLRSRPQAPSSPKKLYQQTNTSATTSKRQGSTAATLVTTL